MEPSANWRGLALSRRAGADPELSRAISAGRIAPELPECRHIRSSLPECRHGPTATDYPKRPSPVGFVRARHGESDVRAVSIS